MRGVRAAAAAVGALLVLAACGSADPQPENTDGPVTASGVASGSAPGVASSSTSAAASG